MAESLQCPSCGTRTRVGSPAPDTITCGRCGRGLKLPASSVSSASSASSASGVAPPPRARRRGAAAAPPPEPSVAEPASRGGTRSVSSGADAPPAPRVPRRRRGSADPGTAVLGVSSMPAAASSAAAGPVTIGATGATGAGVPPARQPGGDHGTPARLVRILAWVVALPIALIAVGIPARKAGYLTGQKLLDVIVKHDLGRFVPLVVIVALWALVTAVLVTLFLAAAGRLSHGTDAPDEALARAGRSSARRSRGTS